MPSLKKRFIGGLLPRLTELLDDGFLFQNLPLGAHVYDSDGKLIRHNRAATDLRSREPRPAERFCGSIGSSASMAIISLAARAYGRGAGDWQRLPRSMHPNGAPRRKPIMALVDFEISMDHK